MAIRANAHTNKKKCVNGYFIGLCGFKNGKVDTKIAEYQK
jgi:hypothetical protein